MNESGNLFPTMNRQRFLKLSGTGLAGALLLGTAGEASARTGPSLMRQFEFNAKKYKVPQDLLLAMGYVNTMWEMPPSTASDYEKGELEGRGAYGIMSLYKNPTKDTLGKAASSTGTSEKRLKDDRSANIRGGAATLAETQGEDKPTDLKGWYDAVAEYGDGELYAQEVYKTLKTGASATISTGEKVELSPQTVEVPQTYAALTTAPDYPGAVWRPAYYGNYTSSSRESSYNINKIVVHVAQGSYSSTVNWFQNRDAMVSAHYVVRWDDGQIAQCVRHKDIAYHAGNWNYNTHSIGIEHSGYVNNPRYFTRAMYRSSARLSAYICRRHKIPVDRKHIIGHYQVPGTDHTDPGKYWDWRRYMKLVRAFL